MKVSSLLSHVSLSYCDNWVKSPSPQPSSDSHSAEAAIPTRPGGESGYPPSGAGLFPRQTPSPLTSGMSPAQSVCSLLAVNWLRLRLFCS